MRDLQPVLNPVISEHNVRTALKALLYTAAARTTNPLEFLSVVDERLEDPLQPHSPLIRRYTLNAVLADLITDQLRAHRVALHLALPTPAETLDQALYHIAADGKTDNPELISASWLYYHYIRVDLGITRQLFWTQVAADERTLRRYQAHGVRRLTERLIMLEYAARRGVDTRFTA